MLQITEIYADKLKSSNKTSNLGFSLPVHDNYYVWKKKKQNKKIFFLSNNYFQIWKKKKVATFADHATNLVRLNQATMNSKSIEYLSHPYPLQ